MLFCTLTKFRFYNDCMQDVRTICSWTAKEETVVRTSRCYDSYVDNCVLSLITRKHAAYKLTDYKHQN